MSDHYEVLGVARDADRDEIRSVHREKTSEINEKLRHPKTKNRDALREEKGALNRAWSVLADPYQRERYDAELVGETHTDDSSDSSGDAVDQPGSTRAGAVPEKMTFRDRLRAGAQSAPRGATELPAGLEPAPVMKRLGAAFMDVAVMGAFVTAMATAVYAITDEVAAAAWFGVLAVVILGLGAYNLVPVVRTGQTLGHRLMGLRVVSADDGALLDARRAVRRYALPVLLVSMGNVFQMAALLVGLSFLFSQGGVSLLDRFARSRVVVAS